MSIKVGNNIVHAYENAAMSIFTVDDTRIVYALQDDGSYISFDPARSINRLEAIEANKGYLVVSKTQRDIDCFTAPAPIVFSTDTLNDLPAPTAATLISADAYTALEPRDASTLYIIPKTET